jgi:hypothetical protein
MMKNGTISCISRYCLLTQARKKTTTSIGSQRFAICNCNCNVKKEIKPPKWEGNLTKVHYYVHTNLNYT